MNLRIFAPAAFGQKTKQATIPGYQAFTPSVVSEDCGGYVWSCSQSRRDLYGDAADC